MLYIVIIVQNVISFLKNKDVFISLQYTAHPFTKSPDYCARSIFSISALMASNSSAEA